MIGAARPSATEVLAFIRGRQDDMVELVRAMAEAESPSDVPESQQDIREIIAGEFERRGFTVQRIPGQTSGGMLHAWLGKHRPGDGAQLILGHYDTVWPLGTLEDMPFDREGDVLRGPGVYDMKGGLAQALLAFDALEHFDLQPPLRPHVFLNSDEEIGSRESRDFIEEMAPEMERVFVLEPSLGPSGQLKTARKGIGRFTVRVTGEAAHAGLDPGAGASAILELSHVIQDLFALNDLDRGITVNVGTIDGGLRPNVVAPASEAVADVRVPTTQDAERIEAAIRGLEPVTPGTKIEVEGLFGRPAMERTPANRALWRLARSLGDELGLSLEQATAGGGSDGNFTSLYTATLDGMGAVGAGAHARHEHLCLAPSLERAALLALLLAAPGVANETPEARAS